MVYRSDTLLRDENGGAEFCLCSSDFSNHRTQQGPLYSRIKRSAAFCLSDSFVQVKNRKKEDRNTAVEECREITCVASLSV